MRETREAKRARAQKVVRTWDPAPRIASRLPVPVTLGRIDITPEAIRISAR